MAVASSPNGEILPITVWSRLHPAPEIDDTVIGKIPRRLSAALNDILISRWLVIGLP